MKKRALALVLLVVMMLSLAVVPAYAEENDKDLVILYTSDVHCGIDQGWGYAGLYAVKKNLEKKYNVLLVDDGDAIQGEPIGTMTKGEAIIDIMNTIGYDVAIPGNHEFDYGVDRFLELSKRADFPYISCNFNKDGELLFQPWLIKEVGGMKIGFVGVTTPDTLRPTSWTTTATMSTASSRIRPARACTTPCRRRLMRHALPGPITSSSLATSATSWKSPPGCTAT